MTTALLYPIVSKGFALLYFPLFFTIIMMIDRTYVIEEAEHEHSE